MSRVLYFIVITFFSLLSGCSQRDPMRDEFIGSWKSIDGAMFIFNSDGTFSSENLSGEKMFERKEYNGKKYSESGTWELKNQSGKWRVYLSFNKVGGSKGGVGSQLNIVGEKKMVSNQRAYYLFKYVSDPDDGTMYEFRKLN